MARRDTPARNSRRRTSTTTSAVITTARRGYPPKYRGRRELAVRSSRKCENSRNSRGARRCVSRYSFLRASSFASPLPTCFSSSSRRVASIRISTERYRSLSVATVFILFQSLVKEGTVVLVSPGFPGP